MLKDIPHKGLEEGEGTEFHYSKDFIYETQYKKIGSSLSLTHDEIFQNPKVVYIKMEEMAKDIAFQQSKLLFDTLSDITEKTGNVVRRKGQVTPESLLEIFEKVQIDFNERGEPIFPTIHSAPDMTNQIKEALQQIESDSELHKKLLIIVAKQKERWYDREINRKLVN